MMKKSIGKSVCWCADTHVGDRLTILYIVKRLIDQRFELPLTGNYKL